MNILGTAFISHEFPQHYYQVVKELDRGVSGIVYLVILHEQTTDRPVRPYAAKVVYEQFLCESNEEQRRHNLR